MSLDITRRSSLFLGSNHWRLAVISCLHHLDEIVNQVICTNCGYDLLHVHRTGDELITYCPQCGDERREKRVQKREVWTEERRKEEARKRLRMTKEAPGSKNK